jgi:hypothetical protein
MNLYEEMKKEMKAKEARRRALSLKNLIPDVRSAAATAMNLDLLCKGNDVYAMVLNGIEASQRVQEAASMIRGSNFVRNLLNDGMYDMGKDLIGFNRFDEAAEQGGLTSSLEESAKQAEFAATYKAGESLLELDRFFFAAQMFSVITTYIQVWMTIAGGWAEAKASILEDNSASGLGRGVVMGANDCGRHYVAEYWMHSTPSYPAYHEMDGCAKNVYNLGLVTGYAAGKELSRTQKGNLFSYLHDNMSEATRKIYSGSFPNWSLQKKKSYYVECGAIFRANLIEN